MRTSLLLLAAAVAFGQTGQPALKFDAASVKPAKPLMPDASGVMRAMGPTGGPGTSDPSRFRFPPITLRLLLMTAYDLKPFQIVGPAWIDSEYFEVEGTAPPATTREQSRVMLQNLLTERFQMTLHRETKELPIYALVPAKNGPKLQESGATSAGADGGPPPTEMKVGPDGFPVPPPGRAGLFGMSSGGRTRLIGQQQTMQALAARLTTQLARLVRDETGLTGKYDFVLTYTPDSAELPPGSAAPPDGDQPPDLYAALQSQLGLRLESKKGPVETIVIDRAEKVPVGN